MANVNETMIQGTKVVSGDVASFNTPREVNITSLKVYFSPKQAGEGTPSPNNVRSISGWTGVEIEHCGRNLFNKNNYGYYDGNSGVFRNNDAYSYFRIPVKPGDVVRTDGVTGMGLGCYFFNGEYVGKVGSFTQLTIPDGVDEIASNFNATRRGTAVVTLNNPDVSYEPYKTKILLPKEYQEVEWIEGDISAHIDTGIAGNDNTLEISFKVITSEWAQYSSFFGNYIDESHNVTRMIFSTSNNGSAIFGINRRAQGSVGTNLGFYPNQIGEFEVKRTTVTFNGQTYNYSGTVNGTDNSTNIALNANKVGTTAVSTVVKRWYYCKIKSNGGLVRDFIPCYRKSDGKSGMYDIVTRTFFASVGSKDFLIGPEVNPHSIDWTSDAGTVYGGYVDLVSGELIETHECDRLSTVLMGPNYHTDTAIYFVSDLQNYGIRMGNTSGLVDLKCNYLESKTNTIYNAPDKNINCIHKRWSTQNQVGIVLTRAEVGINIDDPLDVMNSKTLDYLTNNSIYASYKLATPITYQLSPATLTSLVQTNTFWSNADRVEVEYEFVNKFNAIESRKNIFTNTPRTETISGNILNFGCDMGSNLKECKVYFKPKQLGEGDPSPENVRPIEGWDGITVNVAGNNLYGATDGSRFPIRIPANTMVTAYAYGGTVRYYREDGTRIDYWSLSNGYRIFRLIEDAYYFDFSYASSNRYMIGIGNGIPYEPYQGTSITITFPKTIYGGYVDLTNGEIVEEWNCVDMGDLSWSRSWNAFVCIPTGIAYHTPQNSTVKVVSEIYKSGTVAPATGVSVNKTIKGRNGYLHTCIEDTDYNGVVSDFKAGVTGYKMAYKLATSNIYTIDPVAIQTISTLRGVNTIYSNSNDVTKITYFKHGDDSYTHIPVSNALSSNDNFILVTDDGYVIGDANDYIVY